MHTRKKKAIIIVIASICAFVLLLLAVCCLVSFSLIHILPDEEIVGVVRVFVHENGEEEEIPLPEEKISLFSEHLNDLRYNKNHNIFEVKSRIYDSVTYVITYDSYTVKLREHYVLVLHNGKNEKEMSFDHLRPSDAWEEMDLLFE